MGGALAAILDHAVIWRMETNTEVGGAGKEEPGSLMVVELSYIPGLSASGLVLQDRNELHHP